MTWGMESKWAGDSYDGDWLDGVINGYGVYNYSNGSKWA